MEDVEVELNVLACEKDMILGDPMGRMLWDWNAAPPNSYLEALKI